MIVVRDIFRVKFGQAKAVTALWKKAIPAIQKTGYGTSSRLLTDVAGPPYYTIIFESMFESLADWEKAAAGTGDQAEWAAIYKQIVELTETGHREILRVIE